MKEDDIIDQLLTEVESAAPSGVSARTSGGDQDTSPPEIVLNWSATRLQNENGHNSFGGYVTSSGDRVGVENHAYFRMEAEFILRWYDEIDRDQTADAIQMSLLPYEKNSENFNQDTAEWEIGSLSPRNNSVIEPDWYESSLMVSFKYVKRVEDTSYDTIQTVETIESVDETLDTTTTDTS